MILIEQNIEDVQPIRESADGGGKWYLQGVFMEAERKNRNGRIYSKKEMKREVEKINAAAQSGNHILGELDHPSNLEISLKNVSHKIVEMRMEGDQAIGKAEILEHTQAGSILKGLVESGVRVGVSSRAKGQLDASGRVSNFSLVTIDAVAVPSAQNAYPQSIMESLEEYKRSGVLSDLAEAVVHDPSAQEYFAREMRKFIESLKA